MLNPYRRNDASIPVLLGRARIFNKIEEYIASGNHVGIYAPPRCGKSVLLNTLIESIKRNDKNLIINIDISKVNKFSNLAFKKSVTK